MTPVDFEPARAVADAVLYEGYLLYPYRRSSAKNRVRWQFGVLAPPVWAEANTPPDEGLSGSAESWWNRTECLLEAPPATAVELRLRFLHLQPGPALDRAMPHEVAASTTLADLVGDEQVAEIAVDGVQGRLRWGGERVEGPFQLHRLSVRVENTDGAVPADCPRDEALRAAMISTHLLLGVDGGGFISIIDPPHWAEGAARSCRNVRTFPVLTGPEGTDRLMLSAPIILPDHPRVAPESPGDLFDATEIDEILSLRTMALTDQEKAEARATDPRAEEIIDRVDTMPPEIFGRLHGAIRSLRRMGPEPIGAGSRVRLRPRSRGGDIQDMFLTGRTATVETVLTDVDGSRFLAVYLDDDPRAEMGAGPGRLLHFSPEEVETIG